MSLSIRYLSSGFPGGATDQESACQCRRHKRRGFDPWVWKIPWSRKWHRFSTLVGSILWTGEPGGLQSTEFQKSGMQRSTHTTQDRQRPQLPRHWVRRDLALGSSSCTCLSLLVQGPSLGLALCPLPLPTGSLPANQPRAQ